MKIKQLIVAIAIGLAAGSNALGSSGGYLFATFRGEQSPMGEQVYFALSPDGRHWEALNGSQPVLISTVGEKGVRDPYLLRSHDGKKFYLLATDLSINLNPDWGRAQHGGSQSLVIWDSPDLVHWSSPRLVKVASNDAGCTWAPEAVYDQGKREYLVFWASRTAGDHFNKQRIWAAWTKDFVTFGEPFVYIDKPWDVIDTDIVRANGKFYRFSKDEQYKSITMEVSTNLMGRWDDVKGFSLAKVAGYEGPECYPIEPASRDKPATWCLILDQYSAGTGYHPFVSADLSAGEFKPGEDFAFPFHFRHGSVLPISEEEYQRLEAFYNPAPARLFPLSSVRLLDSPFASAVVANRAYLLDLDPDRLLAPFRREAGLPPRKPSYGNWESSGLDGHTAGHYLTALAYMMAAGNDTAQNELRRRLDYMVAELARCQKSHGDGYVGGVPGSRAFWPEVAAGRLAVNGFGINGKWVPWYNLHKTFAGLRDAYQVAGNTEAKEILVHLADWCDQITSGLTDEQMQRMLQAEHGGMCEVLADIYAMTRNEKYLKLARRFIHRELVDPLLRHEDRLTGLHANTQIPKVIGLEKIASLTGDEEADSGARFFWEVVTRSRSVAFGGNSVSEHFNDPRDFMGMVESREGPETCNTYNMLRLTEQLFSSQPAVKYVEFYERALYNHILSAINPTNPGYVYFTPIRPEHYRVYSQPDQCFWCCVGTGMENPGRYGEFIYARATNGIYVNLFIASELSEPDLGLTLRQETRFPDEEHTRLVMHLAQPATFSLHLRHPAWVGADEFVAKVNGEAVPVASTPSSYVELRRTWRDGDRVEVELPMHTAVERIPDGSAWLALLHGPVVLAAPAGTNDLVGLRANDTRMGHIASGPLVPLDEAPVLLATEAELPAHVVPDPDSGPLHFRLTGVLDPSSPESLPLIPFFRLHDARYQMYWPVISREQFEDQRARLAAEERARAARAAATLDAVAIGEQQPEVEHGFAGEDTRTGVFKGRRWRDGKWFQYTFNPHGETPVDLVVTYWSGNDDRVFEILANGKRIATERLDGSHPGRFFEKRYPLSPEVLAAGANGRVTVKFIARTSVAGGVFDLRLMRPITPVE